MRRSRACAHGLPWWLQVTRTYVRACVRAHAHRTHALIGAGGPEGCSPWQDGCGWRGVVEAGRPARPPAGPPTALRWLAAGLVQHLLAGTRTARWLCR